MNRLISHLVRGRRRLYRPLWWAGQCLYVLGFENLGRTVSAMAAEALLGWSRRQKRKFSKIEVPAGTRRRFGPRHD